MTAGHRISECWSAALCIALSNFFCQTEQSRLFPLPQNKGTLSISAALFRQITSFVFVFNLSANQNHFSEIKLHVKLPRICDCTCNFPSLISALLFTTHLHVDPFRGGGFKRDVPRTIYLTRLEPVVIHKGSALLILNDTAPPLYRYIEHNTVPYVRSFPAPCDVIAYYFIHATHQIASDAPRFIQ